MKNTPRAGISEIFSSIQGEGLFVGVKQIFVRFAECNLACSFCDEAHKTPARSFTPQGLVEAVKRLDLKKGPHHSVSLTGGEPLLYQGFLEPFLKLLKKEGYRIYLETNGTLPDELAKLIGLIDIVAMDFKLPSSTGEEPYWKEHTLFLKLASKKDVFVKVVVTPDTARDDILKTISIIKKIDMRIALIFQPALPRKAGDPAVGRRKLLGFLDMGVKNGLKDARIIPQVHKMLGIK